VTKKPNKPSKRLPPPSDDDQARIIRELKAKVASLEEELRRRDLEASFLESALRKVEAVRRRTPGTEPGF
jgi:hypothetical protein